MLKSKVIRPTIHYFVGQALKKSVEARSEHAKLSGAQVRCQMPVNPEEVKRSEVKAVTLLSTCYLSVFCSSSSPLSLFSPLLGADGLWHRLSPKLFPFLRAR